MIGLIGLIGVEPVAVREEAARSYGSATPLVLRPVPRQVPSPRGRGRGRTLAGLRGVIGITCAPSEHPLPEHTLPERRDAVSSATMTTSPARRTAATLRS